MDRDGKHGRGLSGGVAAAVRLFWTAVIRTGVGRRVPYNPDDLSALISSLPQIGVFRGVFGDFGIGVPVNLPKFYAVS